MRLDVPDAVRDCVFVPESVRDALAVADRVGVREPDCVVVGVRVDEALSVVDRVTVGVCVTLGVRDVDWLFVRLWLGVGVTVSENVCVIEAV